MTTGGGTAADLVVVTVDWLIVEILEGTSVLVVTLGDVTGDVTSDGLDIEVIG